MPKKTSVETKFHPPGKPMSDVKLLEADTSVLLAKHTEVCASGPTYGLTIGTWDGEYFHTRDEPHVQPIERYQCWWPLPRAEFIIK